MCLFFQLLVMEVATCADETDHCTYTLYNIIREDYGVPQSDVVIRTVDIDELGTICTADDLSLSLPHHPYMSSDNSGQICEDDTLEHRDNDSVDVQDVVEEEVNFQIEADGDAHAEYEQVVNGSEAMNAYIKYVQNVVIFCCYVCGCKCTRLQTLKGHMKRQHGTDCDVSRVVHETLPTATVCRQCGYVGTTQQATCLHAVRKHRLSVDRPSHQCKTNPRRLMLSRQRMRAEKAVYPPIECLICRSEIGLVKNYSEHIKRMHHGDGSEFAEAVSDLRRIQFERTRMKGGVVMNCETCGESCDENRLIAHIRWRHGNSANVSQLIATARQSVCSSKQQREGTVRSELVSCPHCGRRLRQISLANHIKFYCGAVESGSSTPNARRYVECTICHQSMPRPKLFRHRRLVHRIGSYKQVETFMCEFCPREFSERHQLRTHVKKHTGIILAYF